MNGSVNPNGLATLAWFEWGTTTNYDNATAATDSGLGSARFPLSSPLTHLLVGVTYHYRMVGSNGAGLSFGVDRTLVPSSPPTATTLRANGVEAISQNVQAALCGWVNPNWAPTTAWFEWGPGPFYAQQTPATTLVGGMAGTSVNAALADLSPDVVYHYRLAASNNAGISFGSDQIFSAPGVTLNGPGVITNECHSAFTDPGARVRAIRAVAGGAAHSLALTYDGAVLSWGAGQVNEGYYPNYGQAMVPPGLSNVVAIAAGGLHSLALKADGTVVAWGYNAYTQTSVPPGLSNVVAIAAGDFFSVALRADGTVVEWGEDDGLYGTSRNLSDIVALSGGGDHVLTLKRDGTVVAWGAAGAGEYGAPSGLSNVVAVAAGDSGQSIALRNDGTVVAWNRNDFGQGEVPPGLSNVVAISAGAFFDLALRGDGTVTAWGGNQYGALDVPAGLSNVVAIAAGDVTGLALTVDDQVIEWGAATAPADLRNFARSVAALGTVDTYRPGIYTLTYKATNAFGGVGTATRIVVVQESPPPEVVCPADITIESTNASDAVVTFQTTATDTCDGRLPVGCNPPSGTTFPFGATFVRCTATNSSGKSASCMFNVTVAPPPPRAIKSSALAALLALRASVSRAQDLERLDEAISHLGSSLDPAFWIDQAHLVLSRGQQVFNEEKAAVLALTRLLNDQQSTVPVEVSQVLINRIVQADRLLALAAIQDASTAAADNQRLVRARQELAQGGVDVAQAKYEAGIEHFRNAWKLASRLSIRVLGRLVSGTLHLEFPGFPGESYVIEASTNLTDWVALGTEEVGPDGVVRFNDARTPRFNARFYRTRTLPQ